LAENISVLCEKVVLSGMLSNYEKKSEEFSVIDGRKSFWNSCKEYSLKLYYVMN
jgi:hypothetical protein